MPQTLSLESQLFQVHETKMVHGVSVPWQVSGYAVEYERAQAEGGFFDLSDWGVVELMGPDAADYLGRMSTVSLKNFDASRVHHGAFLTGRGLVVSLGVLQKIDGGFHFLVSPGQAPRLAEHIEQFHFSEKFTVEDRSSDCALFGVWGPPANFVACGHLSPMSPVAENWRGVPMEIWRDDSRPALFWVKIRKEYSLDLLKAFSGVGVRFLGRKLFEYFRIKAAVPEVGVEATEKDIILETSFERAVARNKGCYPGQEVVERIFTYGSVNRKLMPIELRRADNSPVTELPIILTVDGKPAGTVVSVIEEPLLLGRSLGLAYIQKQFWERKGLFESVPGLEVSLISNQHVEKK